MPGTASGVKAGEAYIALGLVDRATPKLNAAKAHFEAFAKRVAAIGAGLTAAGGAILGGIGLGVRTFMEMGGALQDMTERTGVSVEALSALGFAADQTGVSLETLEGGLRAMSKFTLDLGQGKKQAGQTAGLLGIDPGKFLGSDVFGRLGMISDALARIEDPGLRAAMAMKVLGKSGTGLLPMLAGGSGELKGMIEDAQRLGIVLSGEDVAKADELGDQLGALAAQSKAALFAIGAAVAEPLLAVVKFLQEAAAAAIQFVRANQALVIGAAVLGAVLVAAGAGLLGLSAAGFVAAGAMTALTIAAAVLEFVLTPIGLILVAVLAVSAALAAGVGYWLMFTESGKSAVQGMWATIKPIFDLIKTTAAGMFDAAMAGNWELVWKIGLAALDVVWKGFVAGLYSTWLGVLGFFQDGWVRFKGWMASAMVAMTTGFLAALAEIQSVFIDFVNDVAESFGFDIKFDGIDALRDAGKASAANEADTQKTLRADTERELKANADSRTKKLKPYVESLEAAKAKLGDLRQEAAEAREAKANQLKVDVPGLNETTGGLQSGGLGGGGGGVLGTFSGAVAGMLGRSTPDVQKDIAKNTERTNELLEEILDKDGLVVD